ncbi:MAG: PhoH family protein [Deltaproteobacteria bacterium]|nr:PhoH family protein [Deltaproteobacteria bacterium]
MRKKIFVLDTNVLLHDPRAIFSFADNEVVIPIHVIEEIDNFKKELSELGRNARLIVRSLDELRLEGNITEGVPSGDGGLVRVAISTRGLPNDYKNALKADDRIVATALECQEQSPEQQVIFVTKDVNLRIRAAALGLKVEDYDAARTDISELYSGIADVPVANEAIDEFYKEGKLALADPYYFPNQFALLRDNTNDSHTALARVDLENRIFQPITKLKDGLWGIRPRNKEQTFAATLLLDDRIKLVTLVGKAGTGKTLLAIAAGLQKVTEEGTYQRLLIARPVFPLGRDLGYLPGDIEEKLNPWMQPIFDNVEFLMGLGKAERRQGRSYHELMDMGVLEIEPLTYIRGRSIPNQFMVVDEAQNLTPHEVKTIISRAGEGTKIVLTGDPYQIDNPYVDATNNGLVHTVNCFRAEKIFGHVTLVKGERSELAELATNLL